MEKILKNIIGEEFLYDVANKNEISILNAGYIITPAGDFIEVKDSDSHNIIFLNYLNKYLNTKLSSKLDVLEASKELTNLNHIVYLGIKTEDIKQTYSNKNSPGGGFAIFILPNAYESTITSEQKESCLQLISTNKSLFGNYNKIEFQVYKIDEEDEIDLNNFMTILENSNYKRY